MATQFNSKVFMGFTPLFNKNHKNRDFSCKFCLQGYMELSLKNNQQNKNQQQNQNQTNHNKSKQKKPQTNPKLSHLSSGQKLCTLEISTCSFVMLSSLRAFNFSILSVCKYYYVYLQKVQ